MLSNRDMRDIDAIRRENLRQIELEAGGASKASLLLGMSPAQFGNLRDGAKDSKTGKPRGMHKDTARRIESAAGKPLGWLDADHSASNVALAAIGTRRVPLVNYVQAGMWTEIAGGFHADEWLLTDLDLSDSAFALEIRGESMLPEFRPGDRIIIDPGVAPTPGSFVVAKNGGDEATFKKYRLRGINEQGEEIIELVPLNPDFSPLRSDRVPFIIIGTMVEHRRYYKTNK